MSGGDDTSHRRLRLFVSYRREGSSGYAGRLYDRLVERWGDDGVFMDIDRIRPGTDFAEVIDQALKECGVLLAMIGKTWLATTDEKGRRRLDSPGDFVRLELETALRRGIPIIPLLVENAKMPTREDLPDSLAPLARRQALELSDRRWRYDVGELIAELERLDHAGAEDHERHPEAKPSAMGAPRSERAETTASTDEDSYPLQLSALRAVLPATSQNAGQLTAVMLQGTDVVATDSIRLHCVRLTNDPGWGRLLLSSGALQSVVDASLPSLPTARLYTTSKCVLLSCLGRWWEIPYVDGEYPDYRSLLPPTVDLKDRCVFARPALDHLLRDWIPRAARSQEPGGTAPIRLREGSPIKATLKTKDSELEAEIGGYSTVTVFYSPKFLLQLFEDLPVRANTINMAGANSPAIIRYSDGDQNEHIRLLMPVRGAS